MAGRFIFQTDTDVENFLNVEENKNTKRKTEGYLTLVLAFLATEKEYRKLEDLRPAHLDTYLSRFLLSVQKKLGEEYEPTTLRGFIASVERHLKKQGYSDSIITGQPFAKGTNHERPLVSTKRRLIYFSRRESWEFIRLKHSLTRCGSTTVYTSE